MDKQDLVYPCRYYFQKLLITLLYPINDTTLELSVFSPSDIQSQINEMRIYEFISLLFKTRLTSATCFCGKVM